MIAEAKTVVPVIEPIEIETKEEYEALAELIYNSPKANKRMLNLLREYRESRKG